MNAFTLMIIILTILAWAFFLFSFEQDRSRYRNCLLLSAALLMSVWTIGLLLGQRAMVLILVWFTLFLLSVPVLLIINGIQMYKKEGHSLPNLLSLLLGIVILTGEIVTLRMAGGDIRYFPKLAIGFSVTVIYTSFSILMFVIYSVFLQELPHKKDFDYVIIHGCGLIDGNKVSKLLSDRLDKAISIYQKDPTPPILIPSGGKGSDESLSEAEAMAGYLKEHGIPEDMIICEDKSATTYENLENSKAIIEAREGSKYTVLVTSSYHVLRALRYARKLNFKCTGVGSHTALYYWPSALIREWVAIHYEKKHMAIFVIGWLLLMVLVFYSTYGMH